MLCVTGSGKLWTETITPTTCHIIILSGWYPILPYNSLAVINILYYIYSFSGFAFKINTL